VYVATRNDALASVIEKCPKERKSDLVFYGQNGYIEDFLQAQVSFSFFLNSSGTGIFLFFFFQKRDLSAH